MPRRKYIFDATADDGHGGKGKLIEVDINYRQPERVHFVRGDTKGYYSVVSDKWVDGARARRDDLARNECRPYEGREQEDAEAARARAYMEARSDAKLDEATERAFAQLSPEQRRQLGG
jgi:hypothetical protein